MSLPDDEEYDSQEDNDPDEKSEPEPIVESKFGLETLKNQTAKEAGGPDEKGCPQMPEHEKLHAFTDRRLHLRDAARVKRTRAMSQAVLELWRKNEDLQSNRPVSVDSLILWSGILQTISAVWMKGECAPLWYGNSVNWVPESDEDAENAMARTTQVFRKLVWWNELVLMDMKYVADRYSALKANPPHVNLFTGQEVNLLNRLCRRYDLAPESFEELVHTLRRQLEVCVEPIKQMIADIQMDSFVTGQRNGYPTRSYGP